MSSKKTTKSDLKNVTVSSESVARAFGGEDFSGSRDMVQKAKQMREGGERRSSFRPRSENRFGGGGGGGRFSQGGPRRSGGFGFKRDGDFKREGDAPAGEGGERRSSFRPRSENRFGGGGGGGRFSQGGPRRSGGFGFKRDGDFKKSSTGRFSDKTEETRYEDGKMRIAKKVGILCNLPREKAGDLIKQGKVFVNGVKVEDFSMQVGDTELIEVSGKRLNNKPLETEVYLLHKPRGYLTTNRDPEGRKTIFDLLPSKLSGKGLKSVGRLDYDSEGLMVLTNDGSYARELELPANEYERVYRVLVSGDVNLDALKSLENGIILEEDLTEENKFMLPKPDEADLSVPENALKSLENGTIPEEDLTEENKFMLPKPDEADLSVPQKVQVEYKPMFVTFDSNDANGMSWLVFRLKEGKNREIRNICAHLGLVVSRLVRISYGPYSIDGLPRGCILSVEVKTGKSCI